MPTSSLSRRGDRFGKTARYCVDHEWDDYLRSGSENVRA
jgi:hypothetical protein